MPYECTNKECEKNCEEFREMHSSTCSFERFVDKNGNWIEELDHESHDSSLEQVECRDCGEEAKWVDKC